MWGLLSGRPQKEKQLEDGGGGGGGRLAAALRHPAVAQAGDDPRRSEQWNLTQIGAPEAWATSTGAGITIGIVDSGIDAGHPDLADKIAAQADCVDGPCRDGSAPDGLGHGTAVSGVAAASTGNGVGIAGVAPDAKLVVARVLDDEGEGNPVDISSGIRWVVDHGAKVVSLSLGDPAAIFSASGNSIEPAIQYAWSRGAIPVLAAGNYNRGVLGVGSPGYGNLNAVVVGATDRTGGVSFYSSPLGNAKWGVVAPGGNDEGPGEDILSTELGGDYAWHAGTSLAVPAGERRPRPPPGPGPRSTGGGRPAPRHASTRRSRAAPAAGEACGPTPRSQPVRPPVGPTPPTPRRRVRRTDRTGRAAFPSASSSPAPSWSWPGWRRRPPSGSAPPVADGVRP